MGRIDENDMENELFLSGRLQIDAAIQALCLTGASPELENHLRDARQHHKATTLGNVQEDLKFYMVGNSTTTMRARLVASVLLVEQSPSLTTDERTAAQGLLEVLGIFVD